MNTAVEGLGALVPPGHYKLGNDAYNVRWLSRSRRLVRRRGDGEPLPESSASAVLARIAVGERLAANGHEEIGPHPGMVTEMRARLLDIAGVRALEPPEPLVEGWLNRDSLAVLYGPSGVGKTFLALDLALSVATGTPLYGAPVEDGPVLYVVAEGASGMGRRIDAWCDQHGAYDPDRHHPVWWHPEAVNVGDEAAAASLGDVAADVGAVLVVLDTLARCTVGVEENSARDMGLVVANLDRIRRATGACVLVTHHTGVADQTRSRGSSALRGALDTGFELTGDDACVKLRLTKQKDGPELAPLHLVLQPVGDRWGSEDDDSSCVLVPTEAAAPPSDSLSATVMATRAALASVAVDGGVSAKVWLSAADCPERTFYRHRARLLKSGLVANVGSDAVPRYVLVEES